jgi:hypothetical protein
LITLQTLEIAEHATAPCLASSELPERLATLFDEALAVAHLSPVLDTLSVYPPLIHISEE